MSDVLRSTFYVIRCTFDVHVVRFGIYFYGKYCPQISLRNTYYVKRTTFSQIVFDLINRFSNGTTLYPSFRSKLITPDSPGK